MKKFSLIIVTIILFQGFLSAQEEVPTGGAVIICPSGDSQICMSSPTMGTIYKEKRGIIIF
jgi:hypothetical protein